MEDVGATAESVIKNLLNASGKLDLTTGQIRKFLTAVNSLTSKIEVYKAQNETFETLAGKFCNGNKIFESENCLPSRAR